MKKPPTVPLRWDSATRQWVPATAGTTPAAPPPPPPPPSSVDVDAGIAKIRRLVREAQAEEAQKQQRVVAAAALAQAGRERLRQQQQEATQ